MNAALFRGLAAGVDLLHAGTMLLWGLGMPLLFWQRYPLLSRAYARFAIVFVLVSVLSHQLIDECVLTTLARELWALGGTTRSELPFTVLFVNAVSGIRFTARGAVLLWETAVLTTSIGVVWYWRGRSRRSPSESPERVVSATSAELGTTREKALHS
jgi:hypothetical protein